MFSKPLAVGVLVVLACITGAAGGAYFAGRQTHPGDQRRRPTSAQPAPARRRAAAQDTEAVVTPSGTAGSTPAPALEQPPRRAPRRSPLETGAVKPAPAAPAQPRRPRVHAGSPPASATAARTSARPLTTPAPAPVASHARGVTPPGRGPSLRAGRTERLSKRREPTRRLRRASSSSSWCRRRR